MKLKHTPGPWVIDANLIRSRGVAHPFPSWVAEVSNMEERDANAALIAAAPDLLKACELLLSRITCEQIQHKGFGPGFDAAVFAVAKARAQLPHDGDCICDLCNKIKKELERK